MSNYRYSASHSSDHEGTETQQRIFPLETVIDQFHQIDDLHDHRPYSIDVLFEDLSDELHMTIIVVLSPTASRNFPSA
jgi:hypothetical protein